MPRKPRITAVPVEQDQRDEGLVVAMDVPDEKTDAEQMTEIIKEVQEEPKEEPSEEAKEEPKEEPKGEDKVGCPDCGKQMSAKTLKYSHGPNCSSKKPKTKAEEQQPTIQREEITEELIEHHIRTRTRADRALRRETMMNKLMQRPF